MGGGVGELASVQHQEEHSPNCSTTCGGSELPITGGVQARAVRVWRRNFLQEVGS